MQGGDLKSPMKKQVGVAQTSVFDTGLYGMNNAWRERSKEKRIENRERERERERELEISENEEIELWFPWMK